MKKSYLLILVLFFISPLFADRIKSELYGKDYEYINKDGTLDWKTLYDEWETIPNLYYMYLQVYRSENQEIEPGKILYKTLGDGFLYDHTGDGKIRYGLQEWEKDSYSDIQLIFSPWNYTYPEQKSNGWIPLGQKGTNYNEAMEMWKFTINQY